MSLSGSEPAPVPWWWFPLGCALVVAGFALGRTGVPLFFAVIVLSIAALVRHYERTAWLIEHDRPIRKD